MSIIKAGESCVSCGLCAKVCPIKIVDMSSDRKPEINEDNENACLNCGQCVAVCPKDTLSHKNVGREAAPEAPKDASAIEAVVKNRRSVRDFDNESVSEDLMKKIMDTVKYAPTGANLQPVKWTIISDKSKIDELVSSTIEWMKRKVEEKSELLEKIPMQYFVSQYESGSQRLTYNAPNIVIAHTDKDYWHGTLDCTISMSYLEIVANSHGLGTCWAGAMDLALKNSEELRALVGITSDQMNHNVLLVGKPKIKYPQIPERNTAKINWV